MGGIDTRTSWPAFWRTTTNRGRPRRFRPECTRRRPSSPAFPRACDSFIRGNSKGERSQFRPIWCGAQAEPIDSALERVLRSIVRWFCVSRPFGTVNGDLLECAPAWEGNWTHDGFVACAWQGSGGERLLAVVNYAPNHSQCYVRLPFADLGGPWRLRDHLRDLIYERAGDDLTSGGLYLDVPAWQCARLFPGAVAGGGPERFDAARCGNSRFPRPNRRRPWPRRCC